MIFFMSQKLGILPTVFWIVCVIQELLLVICVISMQLVNDGLLPLHNSGKNDHSLAHEKYFFKTCHRKRQP